MNNALTMFYHNNSSINPGMPLLSSNRLILILGSFSLLAAGAYALVRFIYQPKQLTSKKFPSLTEAALRCEEITLIQNSEIRLITSALNNVDQESITLEFEQKKQITYQSLFPPITSEKTPLIESRSGTDCKQLLAELRLLMNSYPENLFEDNPCIENIDLYLNERIEHHDKIMRLSAVLLPELSSLLNEAKLAQKIITTPPCQA